MQDRLKIGISLSNRSILFDWATFDDLIEAAKMAEDSGYFDGVWVGDNFLYKPRIEAIVALSAIAAHTQRVRLGTICMASFPLRHPIPLAIQWASLDVLSHGRTVLGVCNGGSAQEAREAAIQLEAMGVQSNERVGRLVEGIAILRRLWSEERVTHQGKYYQFADVELLPKPVQQPVPIFIAVSPRGEGVDEARAWRRVARHGDGWQTAGNSVDTFRRRVATLSEWLVKEGRDPAKFETSIHLFVNINDDPEAAFQETKVYLTKYYRPDHPSLRDPDSWIAYGPPEVVAEKLRAYIDAGCTTPTLRFVSADLKGQLQRCIEEVIPLLPGVERRVPAVA